jgi:heme-degrading monooxygenase HmoA
MILEVAVLQIIPGKGNEFEASFWNAQRLLRGMKGYQGHTLQKCLEVPDQYILLVDWENLEDHTIGFRESPAYQEWKKLLHHFYDPFPTVVHYQKLAEG